MPKHLNLFIIAAFFFALILGCNSAGDDNRSASNARNSGIVKTVAQEPAGDGTIPSGTGVEKEAPAADKANVQGTAHFNDQPAEGVEVKLCEKFNQYGKGCDGRSYTTKTDANGEYLLKDVTPGTYEALTVRVFNTPFYVFATSGAITAAKYDLGAGKTFFAPESHLFKNDLKVSNPKAGAKIPPSGLEITWEPYPDAAYYKVSVHGDSASGATTDLDFVGRRVDGTSFSVDKPLSAGTFRIFVDAFNSNDRKLAQSDRNSKITVAEGN